MRAGRSEVDSDLDGPSAQLVGAGVSNAGRPQLPIRLMVLLYLKHAYNESDESVVQRWARGVYFQFFSGMAYFEPRPPCDDSQIGRFRQALGEAGVEQLLRPPSSPSSGRQVEDHGTRRCWLKGSKGDALHAVLCAAVFNIR